MGNHAFGGESSIPDGIDHEGVAIRTKMDAENVQLLAVRNDTPIDRHVVREDAELDETSELPNHLQTLYHSRWMACRFNVNVASVAVGHLFDFFHHVFFQRVHDEVGTEFLSEF